MTKRAVVGVLAVGLLVVSGCYHFAQLAALVQPRGESNAPQVYLDRCATCHGATGRGDGLGGRGLDPGPRDFGDAAWQAATTDERIRFVVRNGGEAAGLSSAMAAHADLSEKELGELMAWIRAVGDAASVEAARRASTP